MGVEFTKTSSDGDKFYYKDPEMTISHRTDGPAVEYADGGKTWWLNGERHRLDGPAIEWANGAKEWYVNDRLHRVDGPAIEWVNGAKEWFVNGVFIFEVDRSGNILRRILE